MQVQGVHIMHYVGIGASAGGQEALCEFFDCLPSDTSSAYFIITHLSRTYRSRLCEILQQHTQMPVTRIEGPTVIEPNHIYVQPENCCLHFDKERIQPKKRHHEETINRAVDTGFKSLAANYKILAIGIILSGLGDDGTEGVLAIKDHGGKVLVQDPHTTQYNGMPISAILNDHPSVISRPADLAIQLNKLLTNHPKSNAG